MKVEQCPATIPNPDPNALDQTRYRDDGHRFFPGTHYADGSYNGRCLKCGMMAQLQLGESGEEIVEIY
jgi:hypothetical protein